MKFTEANEKQKKKTKKKGNDTYDTTLFFYKQFSLSTTSREYQSTAGENTTI